MKNFTIGSVPVHLNLPWHINLENKAFNNKQYHVKWKDFPGGTGAMCTALRTGDIDMAIILTEGIIKDIADGNPCKLIQTYIQTPLLWGIHVASGSRFDTDSQLQGKRAAVSSLGSGSHLMAYIHAQNNSWDVDGMQFEVVGNIDGAIEALTEGNADYLLWERFTAKPLVDKGIFRCIGHVPTPWPCFVIAVRNELLESTPEFIRFILSTINKTTKTFKGLPNIASIIADRYDQKTEDIEEWLKETQWSQDEVSRETVDLVQDRLSSLNLIRHRLEFDALVHVL